MMDDQLARDLQRGGRLTILSESEGPSEPPFADLPTAEDISHLRWAGDLLSSTYWGM